jgi:phosphatidylglycerophosphate synthase
MTINTHHTHARGKDFLALLDRFVQNTLCPLVPTFIQTNHLTLLSLIWSIGILFTSYVARLNHKLLFIAPLFVIAQYITDVLDGEIGRRRKTGLIKWGFYMDHFTDCIFLLSITLGFQFFLQQDMLLLLTSIFFVITLYLLHSFISFSLTNQFRISYYGAGTTEMRILLIACYILMAQDNFNMLRVILYILLVLFSIGLLIEVYQTQRKLWKMDQDSKR